MLQIKFTYGGRLVPIKSTALDVSGFHKLTQSIFQRFPLAQFNSHLQVKLVKAN